MGWKETVKNLERLMRDEIAVGWHETAKYPDGTPVAQVASAQEFGTNRIPPRSFVRSTIGERRNEWSAAAASGFKAVANGRRSADQVLIALGELAAGNVRMKISQIYEPELAASTIRARTRAGYQPDKPLVRTGLMLTSCTAELVNAKPS